ncbi:MAG: hypothetical protein KF830_16365 [Planctomycetes bacterium]|nr:hypothetical protein [Planctomycetota bacterium]
MLALAMVLGSLAPTRGQDLALDANPFPGFAEAKRPSAIVEADDGRLWVAFHDLLQVHDGRAVRTIELAPDAGGLRPAAIRSLAVAADGTVWLGTERGVWTLPAQAPRAVPCPETSHLSVWQLLCVGTDVWIRAARALAVRHPEGDLEPVPVPGRMGAVNGLAATASSLWTWTSEGLWSTPHGAVERLWTPAPGAPKGIRTAAAVDGALLCAAEEGLWRLDETGLEQTHLAAGDFRIVAHTASTAATHWLASASTLLALDRGSGRISRAAVHVRGDEPRDLTLYAIATDAQGLLWLGTDRGVLRCTVAPGIDNFVLPEMASGEQTTALAEPTDGGPVLGTSRGHLWRQGADGWASLPTPWANDASTRPLRRIEALASLGSDLVVATNRGLWRFAAAQWQPLGTEAGITSAVTLTVTPDGSLWIADRTAVWRLEPGGAVQSVPLDADEAQRLVVSSLLGDGSERLWLGAFRGGLAAYDPAIASFCWQPPPWAGDSVLGLAEGPGPAELWVATMDGLWLAHLDAGTRTLQRQTARTGMIRSLARAADGTLWVATTHHLIRVDPHTRTSRELSPRHGAHPLGYPFRVALRRQNGEVWFGAGRGYTRIHPGANPAGPPGRLARFEVSVAGTVHTLPEPAGDLELRTDAGPVQLHAELIERSVDHPPLPAFVLCDLTHGNEQPVADGNLGLLPTGRYEVLAVVEHATGTADRVRLGTLSVHPAPPVWPWWVAGTVALLGLGAWVGHQRRSRPAPAARLQIERVLELAGRNPDELLDLASLTTTVAERCLGRTAARHGSVSLRARGQDAIRIAEFGPADPVSRAPAPSPPPGARALGEGIWCVDRGDRCDLYLGLGDSTELQFELQLGDAVVPAPELVAELRTLTEPVRAGLRRLTLLRRLERDLAHRHATLEADAHDIRSPLTALQLSSHELAHQLGTGDAQVQTTASTILAATERIVAAIDHLVLRQQRAQTLQLAPHDPVAIAQRCVQSMAAKARAKQITLELHATAMPPVRLDALWFERVLDNLVGNALKFAPPGSTVRVRCERGPRGFLLHVDDEGPGFGADERESVFLPGVTGSASPTAGEPKSGMGLWIARQAMQAMGGDLWVAAEHHPGARVSLCLPTD